MSKDLQTKWKVPLVDAGDGTGDVVVIFPDEVLELLEWVEGDQLSLDVVENSIKITKNSSIL